MREISEAAVTIRPALAGDARAIAEVHVSSWQSTYRDVIPQPYLDALQVEEFADRWQPRLQGESDMCIRVAEREGQVCGFAAGGPARPGPAGFAGELYAIYLQAGAQRRGLGAQLLRSVAQELATTGLGGMFVWVLEENASRRFYERMGGTPAGQESVEIGGAQLLQVAYGWPDLRASLRVWSASDSSAPS